MVFKNLNKLYLKNYEYLIQEIPILKSKLKLLRKYSIIKTKNFLDYQSIFNT